MRVSEWDRTDALGEEGCVATKRVTVRNQTRGTDLGDLELRDGYLGRLRGLLGRRSLAPGDGIVISPCSSVHMFFMLLSLDVVYRNQPTSRDATLTAAAATAPSRPATRRCPS